MTGDTRWCHAMMFYGSLFVFYDRPIFPDLKTIKLDSIVVRSIILYIFKLKLIFIFLQVERNMIARKSPFDCEPYGIPFGSQSKWSCLYNHIPLTRDDTIIYLSVPKASQTSSQTTQTALWKLVLYFLSNWMGYDRGDSFPSDLFSNWIPFSSKSKGKLVSLVVVFSVWNFW